MEVIQGIDVSKLNKTKPLTNNSDYNKWVSEYVRFFDTAFVFTDESANFLYCKHCDEELEVCDCTLDERTILGRIKLKQAKAVLDFYYA